MRTHKAIQLAQCLLISFILFACSPTSTLTISVIEPASVFVPPSIKKVGIINRSIAEDKNTKLDKVDKILSVEGKDLDKDGASEAILGLHDELKKYDRFAEVVIIDCLDVRSPGMGIFPAVLPWDKVGEICVENKVDAIIFLSFYDTDAKIAYKAVNVQINGPLGVKIPAIEHHANITTNIKLGWRIYDPESKYVLDEYIINKKVSSTGVGINPLKAAEAVLDRKEAVMQVSNDIGHDYALRTIPYRRRVSRLYYVKGTDNFKIAQRRAQTGDWNGAAELWESELDNSETKVAGRAAYNMGIINEINGDLDKAVTWVSKSYSDYNDKNALRYLNTLKRRIEKNKQLEIQK